MGKIENVIIEKLLLLNELNVKLTKLTLGDLTYHKKQEFLQNIEKQIKKTKGVF